MKGAEEIILGVQEQACESERIYDIITNYFGHFDSNKKIYDKVDSEETFSLGATINYVLLPGHSKHYFFD